MGYKSRGNFLVNYCIRAAVCENFSEGCKKCYRYDNFKEVANGQDNETEDDKECDIRRISGRY